MKLTWTKNMDFAGYGQRKIMPAVQRALSQTATIMQVRAQSTAAWGDRTGLARRSLHGYTVRTSKSSIEAVIAIGGRSRVPYASVLEARHPVIDSTVREAAPGVFPAIRRFLLLK